MDATEESAIRAPSLVDALIPLVFMIGMLALSIVLFGVDAADGPLQVALLMSAVVGAVVAHKNGYSWQRVGEETVAGISLAMSAILILLMVGALIGVWNLSGTIATVVYYGVRYIDPAWFYPAAALLTGVVGIVTGSSWTTAATFGVAFMGMSTAMGANTAITAGAVISGAYFGDKMSPLSETTILTPQIVGSDVYGHIRSMARVSIPAYLIALGLFLLLGRSGTTAGAAVDVSPALDALSSVYRISLWSLLPIAVLLVLGIRRYPAFLSILIGTLVGAAIAVLLQPVRILEFAGDDALGRALAALKSVWLAMANGFVLDSAYPAANELFTSGGMSSMLPTVWLIIGAMSFGAVMEFGGFNQRLIAPVVERVSSAGGTVVVAMLTSLGLNVVSGDQYVAIVLPARMLTITFQRRGLHPEALATAVENSGTVTSPLVPWNSCGAYMSATLGVSTFLYLPYCLFNLVNFGGALVLSLLGLGIQRASPDDEPTIRRPSPAPPAGLNK